MKKSLLLVLLFFSIKSFAQNASQYCFTAFTGSYTNLVGGIGETSLQVDDQYIQNVPIGFTFNFCGTNYTTVSVSSNGWMSFVGNPGGNYLGNDLTTLGNIAPALMPLWDDLDGNAGGQGAASHVVTGVAPNRVFTFEWKNWEWNYTANTPVISFQVKLYETTNVIQFIYRQEAGSVVNGSATIGIAKSTSDYQSLPNTNPIPLPSTTNFTTNIATKPANDQVYQWTPPPPCAGQPVAGVATLVNNCPNFLYLAGATCATGLTFQWQSRLVCGGNWANISGATSNIYTLAGVSQPTEFRAYVICNGGASDTSTTTVIASISPCYCASAATSTYGEDIVNVSLGTMNNPSACANALYTSYTSTVPAPNLLKGSSYPVSVSVSSSCGTFNDPIGVAVFIDYNRDGVYATSERAYATATTNNSGNFTVSGTVTVPNTPAVLMGVTGMRVIAMYNVAGTSITDGCFTNSGSYYYGETEDYLVNIQYAPTVTGTGLSPVTYSGTYCSGDSVTLTATAPGVTNPQFLWKLPNNTGWTTSPVITLSNIQPSQGGNYFAYILTGNCPGNSPDTSAARLVQLNVNQTPGKPVVSPVVTYCQGDVFDSVSVFGENLKWYTVPSGGVAGPKPSVNTSVSGTVTYYVSQTVDGCEGPRAPVTITVAPKPQPPAVVSPVGYCQGEPASPLIAQGQNLRWYPVATGGVGTPISPTPGTQAQGTFTWYVTQTIAGCESKRQPVVVNIGYVPNGLITLTRPFVCQYDTITLGYFGNALPVADYIWTLPEGASIVSGSGQGPLVVKFDSSGTRRVKVMVENGGCKGPEAFLDVPVNPSPKLTIDLPEDVCKDQTATLSVTWSTTGIDSFIWDFGDAQVMYGSLPRGPYGVQWSGGGDKTISVVAVDNSCKSMAASDKITVHWLPDATITASRTAICAGDSVAFSVPFEPGGSYQWLPYQYFGETSSDKVWAVVDKASTIRVNVISPWNCKSSSELWLGADNCCKVYFPTAFSPNGDGRNDVFHMLTAGKDQHSQTRAHQISVFRIANRWGQTVFETGDETRGWDGTYGGKAQDMGTYYYYVKYKCADNNFYEERGEVTLIR